jgi:WD40 repeat protein
LIISNVNDGAQVAALAAHSDSVMGLVFSADDKLLASASEDLSVKLWS